MKYLLYILLLSYPMASMAQNRAQESKMVKDLRKFFAKYKPKDQVLTQAPQMLDYKLDNKSQKITITADEFFAAQEFSPELNADIYKRIRKELPKPYRKYEITIVTNGMSIDALIPNRLSSTTGIRGHRTFRIRQRPRTDLTTGTFRYGQVMADITM